MEYIDAEVTRRQINYRDGPGVDVRELVQVEPQRILLEESGLARALPGVVIEVSRPAGTRNRSRRKTDADLFLWVYQGPRALRLTDAAAGRCPRRPRPAVNRRLRLAIWRERRRASTDGGHNRSCGGSAGLGT